MLQVARLAPKLLGESTALVAGFLGSQLNRDGGFADRNGVSDLYYTVFGLEGLLALQAEVPDAAVREYLRSYRDGDGLDFVHLTCLARCWAAMPTSFRSEAPRDAILERIEEFRTADGGYHADPNAPHGTVYGCFLAVGAYQDLQGQMPESTRMLDCLHLLRAADGGYSNQTEMPIGLTPTTAAVATLLRHFGQSADATLGHWLLARCHADGGFFAADGAPIPDLLSTATALHALTGLHVDFGHIQDACLDFVDTLWTSRGGFHGNWSDDVLDCEYTYYGLLALGHLSF